MGSLGDDCNGENKAVSEDPVAPTAPTHPFDSRPSPSPIPGETGGDVNELQFLRCTLPFEDTIPVEDAFDTQVVNLGGETQVLDDLDWCKNMDTQLIDDFDNEVAMDSDGEGTDKTEVLDDGDELPDVELGRGGKTQSLDEEKIQESVCEGSEKGLMEQSNVLMDEQLSSGSVPRFTSVRVESLRASGLAARSSASQGANTDNCSPLTDGQISQESTINTSGSKPNISEEAQEFRNGDRCKIFCPTVRKLFTENSFIETVGHSDRNIDTLEGKELPTCDDGLAGLSYIRSQEPGDLSQSNALACVQKLIDENKVLIDHEIEQGRSFIRKSQHASAAKGAQSLAKKTNVRGINGKTGIYDWDDVREDDGGGDIFCRRKEEFLGSESMVQRSFMKPRKPKGNRFGGFRDNEGKANQQNEITVHSESKIAFRNIKLNDKNVQESEVNVRKNLVNEFDQQSNADISAGQLDATLMRKDIPEMLNVGLDTQIAAEAMEALFHGVGIANDRQDPPVDMKDSMERSLRSKARRSVGSAQHSFSNGKDTEVATRQSKKILKRSARRSDKQSLISSQKRSKNVVKEFDRDVVMTSSGAELVEFGRCHGTVSRARCSVNKQDLPKELTNFTPIAHRTRRSSVVSQLRSAESVCTDCGDKTAGLVKVGGLEQTKAGTIDVEASKLLNSKGKSSILGSSQPGEPEIFNLKLTSANSGFSFPRRTRSLRKISGQLDEPHNLDGHCQPSYQSGNTVKSVSGHKRSGSNAGVLGIALQSNSGLCAGSDFNTKRKTRSSISVCPDFSPQHVDKPGVGGAAFNCNSDDDGKMMSNNRAGAEAVKLSDRRSKANSLPSSEIEVNVPTSDKLLKEKTKSACTSPDVCLTPVNVASPVCIGSGYKKSCRKNLSRSCLMKEINSLCGTRPEPISEPKDSRRRRDLSNVRVLFSHHLDDEIIKQQRKIVIRLKLSIASSITDATHFITDKFVRTRNMLEAIASGKPVVTHLWLENVGRVNYYIDEHKYILRDTKKEKEFGFNLPVSLAHARQRPLLLGSRVLITPNTKPDKKTVSSLVKAVHGQAVERVGRSTLKDNAVPDDLLILSSEVDYEFCVPFLEKGAAVYSSELLLNGIVTQKLEYERHQLFADHVKRTRSTIWMKRDGHNFTPVIKHK